MNSILHLVFMFFLPSTLTVYWQVVGLLGLAEKQRDKATQTYANNCTFFLVWQENMSAVVWLRKVLFSFWCASQNFKKEVQRVADFLNVQVSDAMLEAIQRETSFANMRQNKHDITVPLSKDGQSTIYRKGIGVKTISILFIKIKIKIKETNKHWLCFPWKKKKNLKQSWLPAFWKKRTL